MKLASRSAAAEWSTIREAVSLLEAPNREAPRLTDTARAPFAFGLLWLAPVLLLAAAALGVWRATAMLTPFPFK